eukprot:3713239-Amphidinium_carterae.1
MVYARATKAGRSTITEMERACLTLVLKYLEVARPRVVSFAASASPLVQYFTFQGEGISGFSLRFHSKNFRAGVIQDEARGHVGGALSSGG